MKEECFGILMNRKIITSGIYLFKPVYVIEGTLESGEFGDSFKDNMGYEYLISYDGETAFADDELSVSYIISKEELIKQYGPDLKEAKVKYYDKIADSVHIGFYIYNEDKIGIAPFNFRKMADSVNTANLDPEEGICEIQIGNDEEKNTNEQDNNFGNLDQLTSDDGELEAVAISVDEFEKLLKIDDYKTLKEELQKIMDQAKEITEHFLKGAESNVDGNYIRNLFNSSYDSLLSISDLNEMRDVLNKIEEMYIELSLEIDKKAKQGLDVNSANDFIYNLIDKYDAIIKLNNLSVIKKEIKKIKASEQRGIDSLAQKYDAISKDTSFEIAEKDVKKVVAKNEKIIDVKDMKKFFDEKIIGQEEAKKDVISSIVMNKLSDNMENKNSCLLVGPTGSGKTLIAQTVSQYLDLPIEIIDTTQLTIPGYVGSNIEDFLSRLISKAGNVKKAEEGIVVFDEIDKKGSEKNEDVSGKGVLNTLLPFLQGTTYDVKYNGSVVHFNTSKLTVFATGAFTDVASKSNSESSYKNTNIGFNSIKNEPDKQDIEYKKLEVEDFVKYGNMPIELMGRFSTITQLSGHTKESLRKILTDSNVSVLISEKEKLEKLNISLSWNDEYIDAVAKKALELKTGARSLKSTVEYSIKEARWEVLSNLDIYSGIILTEETVLDNNKCKLVDKDGNVYILDEIIKNRENSNEKIKVKVK